MKMNLYRLSLLMNRHLLKLQRQKVLQLGIGIITNPNTDTKPQPNLSKQLKALIVW